MWVEAIISGDDFRAFAAELFPLSIHLGSPDSDHYVFLSAATEVRLVEDKGLRITCNAQIRWPLLGMDIPINVEQLTVLLEPSVQEPGGALLLGLRIEHADVAWIPSLIDKAIVDAINEALQKKSADLSWNFAKTLSHDFVLPDLLQPLHALSLGVGWGKVRTTSEAMVLVVSFAAHAIRQTAAERARAASEPPHASESPVGAKARALAVLPSPQDRPAPVAVAVGTALLIGATYWLGRGAIRLFGGRPAHRHRAHFRPRAAR